MVWWKQNRYLHSLGPVQRSSYLFGMVSLPYELLETYLLHVRKYIERTKSFVRIVYRMWWNWKGANPYQFVVDYMEKYYPPDWTYANFGPQFRADLYGEYKWEISWKISKSLLYFRSKWMGRSICCLRGKVSRYFSFFIEISHILFRYVVLTSKVSLKYIDITISTK